MLCNEKFGIFAEKVNGGKQTKDAYVILGEKLGYPRSERFEKVLKRLMDVAEAAIAASLPCPSGEIARKLGKQEEIVSEKLDGLFKKGIIFNTSKGYQFARTMIQLKDATGSDTRLDEAWGHELLDLWKDFCEAEWYPERWKKAQAKELPTFRIIPSRKAIPQGTKLLPAEDLEVIVNKATKLAVVACPCRRILRNCDSPVEVCLMFNRGAEYNIARGAGKELTREEAMKLLEIAGDAGLIHNVDNRSEITNVICNCCNDCCGLFYPLIKYGGLEKVVAKSRFKADVEKAICNGCQVCIERCPFEAIEMVKVAGEKKLKAKISPQKCFGCGVCVLKCKPAAIRFMEVRPPEHIPA